MRKKLEVKFIFNELDYDVVLLIGPFIMAMVRLKQNPITLLMCLLPEIEIL